MDDPTIAQLQDIYAQSKMVGWDFSRLDGRLKSDDPWWDFDADCFAAMGRASRTVDLGTGGGERPRGLLDRSEAAARRRRRRERSVVHGQAERLVGSTYCG